MISFHWERQSSTRGVRYSLRHTTKEIGSCFYLPGSKQYRASGAAPVKDGVVLTDYLGGTMRAAMEHLERDWSKRSIGLFGEDDIEFTRGL